MLCVPAVFTLLVCICSAQNYQFSYNTDLGFLAPSLMSLNEVAASTASSSRGALTAAPQTQPLRQEQPVRQFDNFQSSRQPTQPDPRRSQFDTTDSRFQFDYNPGTQSPANFAFQQPGSSNQAQFGTGYYDNVTSAYYDDDYFYPEGVPIDPDYYYDDPLPQTPQSPQPNQKSQQRPQENVHTVRQTEPIAVHPDTQQSFQQEPQPVFRPEPQQVFQPQPQQSFQPDPQQNFQEPEQGFQPQQTTFQQSRPAQNQFQDDFGFNDQFSPLYRPDHQQEEVLNNHQANTIDQTRLTQTPPRVPQRPAPQPPTRANQRIKSNTNRATSDIRNRLQANNRHRQTSQTSPPIQKQRIRTKLPAPVQPNNVRNPVPDRRKPVQQTQSQRAPNKRPQSTRPTLKPKSSVVRNKAPRKPINIWETTPKRPNPIYTQPPYNQAATRCTKENCILPDCSCGKKDVPGGYQAQNIPQIVLLTFDDAVNDLNKELYHDLFETGRTNPNGCPIAATFYVSHEWTDYGQVQNLYADGHEIASHSITHSFGEQFSETKWQREIEGQRDILAAYGAVRREDVRGMRAPFLAVGGNRMFKMLHDTNFTYDSSMPVYENRPPSFPYTLDYKLFHDCMIPPCPTKSYPGLWEVPMVMWQDLNGGRCSMGDGCNAPPTAEGVYKMLIKNFERHYTTNRAPFGLFYHAAWFTKEHHKQGFEAFLDTIVEMQDVWLVTNWQAIQWMRDPTPLSTINNFAPFYCSYPERPARCSRSKVCNVWHKSGIRYMRTCQKCPEKYPWVGNTGVSS